jgi:hypothetical protein
MAGMNTDIETRQSHDRPEPTSSVWDEALRRAEKTGRRSKRPSKGAVIRSAVRSKAPSTVWDEALRRAAKTTLRANGTSQSGPTQAKAQSQPPSAVWDEALRRAEKSRRRSKNGLNRSGQPFPGVTSSRTR